ncbi:MAG: hypothetical protein KFW09_03645 [Oscillospiraceae bacterium]|nr:hypothetical protein [Oscillospiraceae bacterium]
MIKTIIAGLLIGSLCSFTAAGMAPYEYTIDQDLLNIEKMAVLLDNTTNQYIEQVEGLKQMADMRGEDIKLLIVKIDELQSIKKVLEDRILELEKEDNPETAAWRKELKKAERELEIADITFHNYHDEMEIALDDNRFGYMNVEKRYDISELIIPEKARPKPTQKS